MSKRSAGCAVVELNGKYAAVHLSEESLKVPRELLDRSLVLRQALSDAEDTEKVPLVVPHELLQSWLQWRTNESSWDSSFRTGALQIVQFLQAADYLGDEEGCRKLCRQAAQLMLPHPPSQLPVSEDHLKALEDLPSNLQGSVLAACKAPVTHILSILPPHLRMAAMHAAHPSITASGTLIVAARDAVAIQEKAERFWDLVRQLSSLQHLHIGIGRRNPAIDMSCPGPLPELTALTFLHIRGENLPCANRVSLGDGWDIGHLTMLQHLDLIGVGISAGSLSVLTTQLVQLTLLTHLDISHNHLETSDGQSLGECLSRLCSLKHLSLAHCALHDSFADAMPELLPNIGRLSSLTHLDLTNVLCTKAAEKGLTEALVTLPKLQHLNLGGCCLGTDSVTILPYLTGVEHLDIKESSLQEVSLAEFSHHLAAMTRLKELKLSYDGIGDENIFIQRFAPGLVQLTSLRALDTRPFIVSCYSLESMLQHMTNLTGLTGLCMSGPTIRMRSVVETLAKYLTTLVDLQHLSFLGNWHFVDNEPLMTGLGGLTTLTFLELELDDRRGHVDENFLQLCEALAQSLKCLSRLQVLEISSYFCHNKGVKVLAPAIGQLTALSQLRLVGAWAEFKDTGLDDVGVQALCPYLTRLTRLSALHLSAPLIGEQSYKALFNCFEYLHGLCFLHLPDTRLARAGLQMLLDCVARHSTVHYVELYAKRASLNSVLQQYPDERRLLSFRTW